MIHLKTEEQINGIRKACHLTADMFNELIPKIHAGMSTQDIDDLFKNYIISHGGTPAWYREDFPGAVCISVNEEVIHGIPKKNKIINDGDIVSVDIGATFHGFVGDSAWTYPVGEISPEVQNLLKVTEESLFAGIAQMKPDNVLESVSAAIEDVALANKMGIVREYGGHGVGTEMHEDPFLFNYRVGDKTLLKSGMVIAIEPMLNLGGDDVYEHQDGWTVSTVDKKPSAHFEHTILVTESDPVILTQLAQK